MSTRNCIEAVRVGAHVDARAAEAHAFAFEAQPLFDAEMPPEQDAATRADHTVPGHRVARAVERPGGLARMARIAGRARDFAIGGYFPARDQPHFPQHPLVHDSMVFRPLPQRLPLKMNCGSTAPKKTRRAGPYRIYCYPMLHLLVSWFLSALALWLVARIIPGIAVAGFGTALIAAAVIAVVNATAGVALKIVTFPLTVLTLGLFLLLVNALLLKLAAALVPGFEVRGCLSAIIGSVVLTLLTSLLRYLVF